MVVNKKRTLSEMVGFFYALNAVANALALQRMRLILICFAYITH